MYIVSVFNPDGEQVISGSSDNTLKLWSVESGAEVRTFKGHSGPVYSVSFSPDGGQVLSASSDMTLKWWDTQTGQCLETIPLPWIPSEIKWFPKEAGKPGWFATANWNGTVSFFDSKRFRKKQ